MDDQPTETPADGGGQEAPAATFEQWFERVEKTAQMHGAAIPEASEVWQAAFDDGQSPFEAWTKICRPSSGAD